MLSKRVSSPFSPVHVLGMSAFSANFRGNELVFKERKTLFLFFLAQLRIFMGDLDNRCETSSAIVVLRNIMGYKQLSSWEHPQAQSRKVFSAFWSVPWMSVQLPGAALALCWFRFQSRDTCLLSPGALSFSSLLAVAWSLPTPDSCLNCRHPFEGPASPLALLVRTKLAISLCNWGN